MHSTAHSTGPGGGQLCAEPSCSAPRLSSRSVTVATRAHTQLYTQLLHTAFTHSYSYCRYSEEAIGDHYPGCDFLPCSSDVEAEPRTMLVIAQTGGCPTPTDQIVPRPAEEAASAVSEQRHCRVELQTKVHEDFTIM